MARRFTDGPSIDNRRSVPNVNNATSYRAGAHMIVHATIDYIAPRFRAGLITPIFTPQDAERMATLAGQHQAERGIVAVIR